MPSLKDLRRRIGSVKNTKQITRAMKLVAASKLRRAQETIQTARPYSEKIETLTKDAIQGVATTLKIVDASQMEALNKIHPLLKSNQVEKVALMVVSSDRGLCGNYNSQVLRTAWKRYQELTARPGVQVKLFFVGRRGRDFFKRKNIEGTWIEDVWQGRLSSMKADKLAKVFETQFVSDEIQELEIVYTQFKSALSIIPQVKKVLPFEIQLAVPEATAGTHIEKQFIYEPGKEGLLRELIPQHLRMQFFRILADSLASEFGARMTAMESATKNSDKMIAKLSLQANRARQASITKELMEIVSGAETLKG